MDKRNDINEFRKKRRLRRVRLNIAILVLFGLIALFIALNWGRIIAPLKDAALDVGKAAFRSTCREAPIMSLTSWATISAC